MLLDVCGSLAALNPDALAPALTECADGRFRLTLRDDGLPLATLSGLTRAQLAAMRREIDRVLPAAACPVPSHANAQG